MGVWGAESPFRSTGGSSWETVQELHTSLLDKPTREWLGLNTAWTVVTHFQGITTWSFRGLTCTDELSHIGFEPSHFPPWLRKQKWHRQQWLTGIWHTDVQTCCHTSVPGYYWWPPWNRPLLFPALQPQHRIKQSSHHILPSPVPLWNAHILLIMPQTTALRVAFAIPCQAGDRTQPTKTLNLNEHH